MTIRGMMWFSTSTMLCLANWMTNSFIDPFMARVSRTRLEQWIKKYMYDIEFHMLSAHGTIVFTCSYPPFFVLLPPRIFYFSFNFIISSCSRVLYIKSFVLGEKKIIFRAMGPAIICSSIPWAPVIIMKT